MLILTLIIVIFDQVVKNFVNGNISYGSTINLIPNFLSLTNVRNYGAAWSLFNGQRNFFVVVALIAILVILYFYFKKGSPYKLACSLILGGTIGNLYDRINLGYVIDMFQLDFISFPIFNVADIMLTFGVIIVLVVLWRDKDA